MSRRKNQNSKIRFFAFALLVCVGGSHVIAHHTVYAQDETTVVREKTGDMEELKAIRIDEEEAKKLLHKDSGCAKSIQLSAGEKDLLDCGSRYGYQDMKKRSNSEARQFLYEQIEELAKYMTVNPDDAEVTDVEGEQFYSVGVVDLEEYELSVYEKIEVYFTFRNDNPQYFWLSNYVLYYNGGIVVLTYETFQNGSVRNEAFDEIIQTANDVYVSEISDADNTYQKVKKIHDALIADIYYPEDTDRETAHSIAGAMTSEKAAVCEGYAKVMQLMMNYYDIGNIYITGFGGGEEHAWNLAQMTDGRYYWLDATWDDSEYEEYRYDYFLVGNDAFEDHEADAPNDTGVDFLYELPEVSDKNYNPKISSNTIRGDVDENGEVDSADLRLILRSVCGKVELTEQQKKAADVTGEGTVDSQDLRKVLQFICGKIEEL